MIGLVFFAQTFTVEASYAPGHAGRLARLAIRRGTALTAGAALLIVAAAPLALRLYGSSYATHSVNTLRWFALGAIPAPLVSVYVALGRVRRRAERAVAVHLALTAASIAATVPLVARYGPAGGAMACAVVSWTIAACVASPTRREIRVGCLTAAVAEHAIPRRSMASTPVATLPPPAGSSGAKEAGSMTRRSPSPTRFADEPVRTSRAATWADPTNAVEPTRPDGRAAPARPGRVDDPDAVGTARMRAETDVAADLDEGRPVGTPS
jgi:hypothetical protein